MCYAIPAKLVEIKGKSGVVEYFGERRNILLDLDNVQIGDYIYAQGGISVRKVPEKEALEILETWQEIFFELKKTDEAMAQLSTEDVPQNILGVLQKVNLQKTLKREDLSTLLAMKKQNELKVLYEVANNVRQREHGNASCVHGIIEFSNYCSQDCFYCGIRKSKNVQRYRMSRDEIVAVAREAVERHGFKALVLQSGEDPWYDEDKLVSIVRAIKAMGVLVFLSIGDRPVETYQNLYAAGARAVLLRFETSNPKIFSDLRPGTALAVRIALIKELRKIGYIIATGFLLGLPGETEEDMLNNILQTKTLAPDMYSFGPLIPTGGTPLEKQPGISKEIILRAIAVSRLADPNSNILVTTALETLDSSAKREALLAGANSMMINVTPTKYRKLYNIYDNRAGVDQELEDSIKSTVDLLFSLGRSPTDVTPVPL